MARPKRFEVEGLCQSAGAFLSVAYSADYTFLKKGG
jgi:hypothetical protein